VRGGWAREDLALDGREDCAELHERFEAFCRRSLYDVNLVVLFLDAIYLPVRPSGPKEGVICAWGITENGERALVSVRLGMREGKEDRSSSAASSSAADSRRHASRRSAGANVTSPNRASRHTAVLHPRLKRRHVHRRRPPTPLPNQIPTSRP